MADIFISYAHADQRAAQRLAAAFEKLGASVWIDHQISGGSSFSEEIEAQLDLARKVVVLWSKDSIGSRWVRDEATAALDQRKLVPVLLDDCQPPLGFRQVQAIDLRSWCRGRHARLPDSIVEAVGIGSEAAVKEESPPSAKLRRPFILAGIAATLLLLAGAVYVLSGGSGPAGLSTAGKERIPLLVRALEATDSSQSEEAGLASGITDELIDRLRRISELQIGTAGPDGSVPSGQFERAHVVEGNIRSAGDQLKVSARLLKPSGEVLWSQTFDRKLVDLFDVQEQIAKAVADALSVPLDVGANSTAHGGTSNPEAYAAYLQYYVHQWDIDQSVPQRYLERAVALDPDFVKGLVGLSQNYAGRSGSTRSPEEARALLAKMDESSARALAANPDLAIGHAIRGWYYGMVGDLVRADKEIARAAKLDKGNDPELRTMLAVYEIYTGRVKKGAAMRQSNELIDPVYRNDPWKIFDYMMLGRYRESVDLYAKLKRSGQPSLPAFSYHALWAYRMMGETASAQAFARQENLATNEEAVAALSSLGDADLLRWLDDWAAGQTAKAVTALDAAHAGNDRQAVLILRHAFRIPANQALLILWHPVLARARTTDAFEQLVTELGLVRAWRESGDWGDYCRPEASGGISCT